MSSLQTPSPGDLEEHDVSGLYTGLLADRYNDNGTLEAAIFNSHNESLDDDDEGGEGLVNSGEASIFISHSGCCVVCGKDGCRREPCENCKDLLCQDCVVKYKKGGRVLYLCSECAQHYRKWHVRKIIITVTIVVVAIVISLIAYILT